jgi:hypothetical protein
MARTHDHEIVSIYPFSAAEVEALLTHSNECVLMWATKDGWPVGVTHAFVWRDGALWLTFAAHRHRAEAIRRDPRVSVNVSSAGYPPARRSRCRAARSRLRAAPRSTTTRRPSAGSMRRSQEAEPDDAAGEKFFTDLLDSPLRTILAVTPVKQIMYNARTAGAHMAGTIEEKDLGPRLGSDAERMNRERARLGLKPR